MTLLLGFSAVNTGNNLLFLVVSGLLAFMSITGLAGMYNLGKLTPELLPPPEIFAGTPAIFRLRLHNAKRLLPSFLIRIDCQGSSGITVPVIPRRGFVEGTVSLTFPERGMAAVGEVTVSSAFPVNFFNRYWKFVLDERYTIYPRLLPAAVIGSGERSERLGQTGHRMRGFDGELESIYDYTGREPLRDVHWKHSARVDDLLVKEFGRTAAPPLTIEVETLPGPLEERLSRAAWLIQRQISERQIGLKLRGVSIPPGSGYHHKTHLLTELARYGND